MIAIKSNKDLMFPPSFKGTVTMKIDLIQNKPDQEVYEIRIIDTCTTDLEEQIEVPVGEDGETETQSHTVTKQLGKDNIRFKTMSYDELDEISSQFDIDMTNNAFLRENVNELFRQGLLLITQKECSEGQGMYFSDAEDWEIVRG